jgi:hypothetical protein
MHTFQVISSKPMRQCLPFPFGMRTVVDHHCIACGIAPEENMCCIKAQNSFQCDGSGSSQCLAALSHPLTHSLCIPDGPGALLQRVGSTAASGTKSSIQKGAMQIGTSFWTVLDPHFLYRFLCTSSASRISSNEGSAILPLHLGV